MVTAQVANKRVHGQSSCGQLALTGFLPGAAAPGTFFL